MIAPNPDRCKPLVTVPVIAVERQSARFIALVDIRS